MFRDVAVLIPFGNETPLRKQALGHVAKWYLETLPLASVGTGGSDGVWCKAEAVAEALKETSAEILVIADADCIAPGIHEAIRNVRQGASWAMPHTKVYRLNESATQTVLGGRNPAELAGVPAHQDQDPYIGFEGGGVTVLRRSVYLNCPLDPEFRGWGQEDEAWAVALNALHGPPRRSPAPLYHLFHEKPSRINRYAGSVASVQRLCQYKEAEVTGSWNEILETARNLLRSVSGVP
jgi:hypothetical protein